jgi:ribose transport system substrate-binding protein
LAQAEAKPTFVSPGKAFDARAAAGKTVWVIPTTSEVPLVGDVEAATKAALSEVKVKTHLVTTTGLVSDWVTGINSAISEKAAAIILLGIDPADVGPQLASAKSHHIPVVYTFAYQGQKVAANVGGVVGIPYQTIAKIMVLQALADTNGAAQIAIINSAGDLPPQTVMTTVIQNTLTQMCPTNCSVQDVLQVPIASWATAIQGDVSTALIAHPTINVFIPLSDAMTEWVVPAIAQANDTSKVKVETVDGTPNFIEEIPSGKVTSDMGWLNQWVGWASADQALRLITKSGAVANENVPAVLFNSTNASKASGNLISYFGTPYIKGYRKLWGL